MAMARIPPLARSIGPWLVFATALGWCAGQPVESRAPAPIRLGWVAVEPSTRSLSFPARLNQLQGVLEYALVTDYGKTHESLLVTDAEPRHIQAALLLLDLQPSGTNGLAVAVAAPSAPRPATSLVEATVSWTNRQQHVVVRPLHELVALTDGGAGAMATGRLAPGPWLFTGSFLSAEGFAAHFEGSIISVIRDPVAILNSGRPDQDREDIHVPATDGLPGLQQEVTVRLRPFPSSPSPSNP